MSGRHWILWLQLHLNLKKSYLRLSKYNFLGSKNFHAAHAHSHAHKHEQLWLQNDKCIHNDNDCNVLPLLNIFVIGFLGADLIMDNVFCVNVCTLDTKISLWDHPLVTPFAIQNSMCYRLPMLQAHTSMFVQWVNA